MVNVLAVSSTVVGVGALAYTGYAAYWWYSIEKIEKPKYAVTKCLKQGKTWYGQIENTVEIRSYEPFLIAEATITDVPFKRGMGKGFWAVAKFIFGGNKAVDKPVSEAISMTSPVRMCMAPEQSEQLAKGATPVTASTSEEAAPLTGPGSGHVYKVSFVMPSKYSKATLPIPDNSELVISDVAAHHAVAIRFGGKSPSPQVIEAKRLELLEVMKENCIEAEGDVMVYQYHPPFAPGFLRVNEVLYMVKQ